MDDTAWIMDTCLYLIKRKIALAKSIRELGKELLLPRISFNLAMSDDVYDMFRLFLLPMLCVDIDSKWHVGYGYVEGWEFYLDLVNADTIGVSNFSESCVEEYLRLFQKDIDEFYEEADESKTNAGVDWQNFCSFLRFIYQWQTKLKGTKVAEQKDKYMAAFQFYEEDAKVQNPLKSVGQQYCEIGVLALAEMLYGDLSIYDFSNTSFNFFKKSAYALAKLISTVPERDRVYRDRREHVMYAYSISHPNGMEVVKWMRKHPEDKHSKAFLECYERLKNGKHKQSFCEFFDTSIIADDSGALSLSVVYIVDDMVYMEELIEMVIFFTSVITIYENKIRKGA